MKLSKNRTFYYIKEGIGSIFTHGLMSFASICIIIAFLVIMGTFILLAVNITSLVGELESENIILAYVDENLSNAEAGALGPMIRATSNVNNVRYITREQAMDSFIGRYEDRERFEDVEPDWFRHRYEVYVDDVALIAETQLALSTIYGIERVNANLRIAQMLVSVRNVVSVVSLVIAGILLAISLFIMSNTIKLATFERREEIAIMRMVGATNAFIRWPFIYEGFILGTIGAMASFAVLWALYGVAADSVVNFEMGLIYLVPFANISWPMFLLFAAIGFGVGVGGSAMALNKYLKV